MKQTMKQMGLVTAGVAAGFLLAALVFMDRAASQTELGSSPSDLQHVQDDFAAFRSQSTRRVTELTAELNKLRRHSIGASAPPKSAPSAPSAPSAQTPEHFRSLVLDSGERSREFAENRDKERLLAAGFSPQRIEWIKQRAKELQVQREQKLFSDKQNGVRPDSNMLAAFVLDRDIDLRHEIGDDEYERYRVALGRPIGAGIAEVLPGSGAEMAGLKPGDQIVAYGGKRIFNAGELNGELAKGSLGGSTLVEVRRAGAPMTLTVPNGPLGIRNENPRRPTAVQ